MTRISSKPRCTAPKTGYYPDLIAEVAALWERLSENRPFVDGNERSAYTFLAINGVRMTAGADALWTFFDRNYSDGTFSFEALGAWLRRNTRKVP